MTDIRTSRRFPVQLPLKVLGGTNVPVGTTANISAAGVYLWIDGGLEVGSSIDFEVTIPHETIGGEDDAHRNWHAPGWPASSNGTSFCALPKQEVNK